MLVLHKWEVLKLMRQEDLAGFTKYSVVGDIQEELLKEQFYRWADHMTVALSCAVCPTEACGTFGKDLLLCIISAAIQAPTGGSTMVDLLRN